MYVNNVVVVGNLTADPKLNDGEVKFASFRIAVSRWRKKTSEIREEEPLQAEFIDVECWGDQAVNVSSSLRKGDRVIVAGQLKYDQWRDENGSPKSRIRIRASAVGPSLEFESITR